MIEVDKPILQLAFFVLEVMVFRNVVWLFFGFFV